MQIKGNAGYNPLLYAQGQKARPSFADAQTAQKNANQTAEPAGPGPVMMESNSPQIVDVNTILENWGSSNPLADLNVDGIVDAQDLAMVLNAAQDAPPGESGGGSNDSPGDEWSALTGGDLNGDGMVDAMDLAQSLNAISSASSTEQMIQSLTDLIYQTFDTDGDGVLTESNFPDTSKAFGYFDHDNSGVLERNELIKGLTEEYERAMQSSDLTSPGPFAKRWLETFSGMMPIPTYTSPMRLQDLFGAPKPGSLSPLNASILSAQA